jgi:hypothetical protein
MSVPDRRVDRMNRALRMSETGHPVLFALDARSWLDRLTRASGRRVRLGDVPDEAVASIEATGCDLVWLIGVWRTGRAGRRVARSRPDIVHAAREALADFGPDDITGSPFAIAEYEVAPDLGGEEGLARLRRRLARAGIGLVLDFVPNHTALDHPWVHRHPEWYVNGDAGSSRLEPDAWFRVRTSGLVNRLAHGRDPYFPAWPDTAQLDYRVPETREAMANVLRDVATRCDGVRADMAMLVLDDVFQATWKHRARSPNGVDPPAGEFWWHAIRTVRAAYPGFVMIAEAYWGLEHRLQQLGFDYTYDKVLLDRLRAGDGLGVAAHLRADPDYQRRSVRYLENQDELRSAAVFDVGRLRSAALVAAAAPGMLLLHDGQIEGARLRVPVEARRRPIERDDPDIGAFYRRLLDAIRGTAFHRGTPVRLEPQCTGWGDSSNEPFVAWLWVAPAGSMRLAVANLGTSDGRCFLPLAIPGFARRTIVFEDLLSDARYERSGDELLVRGLFLDLPAGGLHLFRVLGARSETRLASGDAGHGTA